MNELATTTNVTPLAPATRTDETLLGLWLHGRSEATRRAYETDARRFIRYVQRPLNQVALEDLQAFATSITELAPASQARTLAAVKSLFHFAHELGYFQFDVARVLKLPKLRNGLSARIIGEKGTLRMLGDRRDNETAQERRDRLIVTLLYAAGLRVSELCALRWRDSQDRDDGTGQITIFGKGGKTRAVRLPASVWGEMLELRGTAEAEAPVFRSRKGGHLDQSAVNRIVHAAAKRARLSDDVSPHWLRHAHASHAIERGAPIHLVQATLGHTSVATTGRYLHARPTESSSKYLAID